MYFHDQDKISVLFDIPSEKRKEFYAGLLFTLYVFRNWYSLGDHEVAQGLVELLSAAGDDINALAERVHVSWKLIVKANKLKAPYALKSGEKIKLPPEK